MEILFYTYLGVIVLGLLWVSKRGALYIFSPFVFIYVSFAVSDVIPLLTYDDYVTPNIYYVTTLTAAINLISIIIFRRQLLQKIAPIVIVGNSGIITNRKIFMGCFAFVMIATGFYTGVTRGLMSGGNVEDLRRTSEIGLGFVMQIPSFALPILFLANCFDYKNKRMTFEKVACVALLFGAVMYLSTAARSGILIFFSMFVIWFNTTKRGLKWWEYIGIYFLLQQIVANFLFIFRGGGRDFEIAIDNLFEHQEMIFSANTIPLMRAVEGHFLYGYSYFYSLVGLIPRFIWPDKPVAIDYVYKEMVDYDFEGGGIYTTVSCDFYINFGVWFFLPYIFWLLLCHYTYGKCLSKNIEGYKRIILIYMLFHCHTPNSILGNIQILFVTLLLFYFFNKKWMVV